MATWTDYKNYVKETNENLIEDFDEAEAVSKIVGAIIEQRHILNLTQRDLASLCKIPHSSVARIESGKTSPNLTTLLKLCNQLHLRLVLLPDDNVLG